ncbi:DUF814 domain-containing protein [Colletotrichum truncatum]|uniref:DUF814 domain-containing protein n=1 Tax=Colletotrichum truncatum TaxID=5467 RepID=A0ACC3Z2Z9_COLTU|nr:duf814 domain-containing protein [Colletotrichum truncatum]KAF6793221.1 duf814 domain-containing protein [Colletotrichum truncatum]
MPRLGYKKSRGGCARCKQRRVKCDENKPCGACIRHNTPCSLVEDSGASQPGDANSMHWEPSRSQAISNSRASSLQRKVSSRKGSGGSRKTTGSSISPIDHSLTPPSLLDSTLNLPADFISDHASSVGGGKRQSSTSPSSPDPFPYFVKFSTGPVEPVHLSRWITDLELMHHYSTATCLTMPRATDASNIWQFEVPRLGLTYMFLMHQVLAISALHLGNLHPEQRESYALHASQHQTDAIAGMRETLTQISPDNCHPLFAASSLLLISAFATFPYQRSGPEGHEAPTVDDVLDVFLLVRGMSNILSSSQPVIRGGPFRGFFMEVVTPSSTQLLDAIKQHLRTFQISLQSSNASPSTKQIVATEIAMLLEWIDHATNTTAYPELRVALTWPIGLTEEFMQLLRSRDPAALTLLAYYSVAVHSTEHTTWFMQGWGVNTAKAIVCDLDPEWKDLIQWPLAFISDRSIQV